jgi:hypothetical protein
MHDLARPHGPRHGLLHPNYAPYPDPPRPLHPDTAPHAPRHPLASQHPRPHYWHRRSRLYTRETRDTNVPLLLYYRVQPGYLLRQLAIPHVACHPVAHQTLVKPAFAVAMAALKTAELDADADKNIEVGKHSDNDWVTS